MIRITYTGSCCNLPKHSNEKLHKLTLTYRTSIRRMNLLFKSTGALLLLAPPVIGQDNPSFNQFLCRPFGTGCDDVHRYSSACKLVDGTNSMACCPDNIIQRWEDEKFTCKHGATVDTLKSTDAITEDELEAMDLGAPSEETTAKDSASSGLSLLFMPGAVTVATVLGFAYN